MIDEGYTKYRARWTRSAPHKHPQLVPLCEWRSRLHAAGLIGEYADLNIGFGNLSARTGSGHEFLISGTQTGREPESSSEQFSLVTQVDPATNTVDCTGPVQASSEAMTHAAVYEADAFLKSVVHIHSEALWRFALENLPATPSQTAYGTPEMAAAMASLLADQRFREIGVVAMAGHDEGLIAVGESVAQASCRLLDLQARVENRPRKS